MDRRYQVAHAGYYPSAIDESEWVDSDILHHQHGLRRNEAKVTQRFFARPHLDLTRSLYDRDVLLDYLLADRVDDEALQQETFHADSRSLFGRMPSEVIQRTIAAEEVRAGISSAVSRMHDRSFDHIDRTRSARPDSTPSLFSSSQPTELEEEKEPACPSSLSTVPQGRLPSKMEKDEETLRLETLGSIHRSESDPYLDVSEVNVSDKMIRSNSLLTRIRGGVSETFPSKLHRVLTEIETASAGKEAIVSFASHGRCFQVHDRERFTNEILPEYFCHKNYMSFVRQLNLYGYTRVRAVRRRKETILVP